MTFVGTFSKAMGRASVFIGQACGVLYITAIFLSVYEVFMRYALDAPTSWSSEIIMMLVATAWALCIGVVTQQNRHITVTTMELLVGAETWRRMRKLAILISMAAAAGMIYACWKPMLSVLKNVQTSGSAFDPPIPTYIKTLIVVAGVLYFLQLLALLIAPTRRVEKDAS